MINRLLTSAPKLLDPKKRKKGSLTPALAAKKEVLKEEKFLAPSLAPTQLPGFLSSLRLRSSTGYLLVFSQSSEVMSQKRSLRTKKEKRIHTTKRENNNGLTRIS
jgi:hypothetical protein